MLGNLPLIKFEDRHSYPTACHSNQIYSSHGNPIIHMLTLKISASYSYTLKISNKIIQTHAYMHMGAHKSKFTC